MTDTNVIIKEVIAFLTSIKDILVDMQDMIARQTPLHMLVNNLIIKPYMDTTDLIVKSNAQNILEDANVQMVEKIM